MNRLSASDIRVGEPIQWDCYDAAGTLLLRKGVLVASERQIEGLIARGLFVSQKGITPEPPPVVRPAERVSPFHIVEEFKRRLRGIFEGVSSGQSSDLTERILKLSRDLQAVCDLDADAVLGMMHLDTESRYTIMHPLYVAILVELIARVKNVPKEQRQSIVAAALTANISIIELQEQLQKQAGTLDDAQKAEMRLHTVRAVDQLLTIGVQDDLWITTVLHHHEKIDGSGYPGAQRGENIPLSVRILSLADTYSAMLTPRVYRSAILARDALRDILRILLKPATDSNPKPATHNYPKSATCSTAKSATRFLCYFPKSRRSIMGFC